MVSEISRPSGPRSYDVAIVGGGPTGLTAANLLGARGRSVVVVERHGSFYGLPRAGHVDHEALRILQSVGCLHPLIDDLRPKARNVWLNARGEVLLEFAHWRQSESGFPSGSMYQPALEASLIAGIERSSGIDLRMDCRVDGFAQDAEGVVLHSSQGDLRASYVIAADGAGSGIRQSLGIPRTDFGFDERWIVVDCAYRGRTDFGPAAVVADPARPHFFGPLGKSHHRFEWKLLPGEDGAAMSRPEAAHDLLATAGVAPGDVEIVRIAVYDFEYRMADRWRDGRIFLMGDAAHTMAPALGQGLCSGMRDAANLCWKLDLVLSGAGPGLLDSYQQERYPNVRQWADMSKAASEIAFVTDPVAAAERDRRFRAGERPAMGGTPPLGPGLVQSRCAAAGRPFAQFVPDDGGLRSDDLFGPDFLLLTLAPAAVSAPQGLPRLRQLAVADLSDAPMRRFYESHLAGLGLCAVLVRPDRYVQDGAERPQEIQGMLDALSRSLFLPCEQPA